MTFFIAIFILLMQFLWLYIDDFIGKGLGLGLLFELMFYTSWTLVPLALPISVLLSSLMTMGNLGEHYELVAAKTSGISLIKLISPLIITAIILSGVAFYFSNYLYPLANLKHQSLLFDVRKKKMAFNLEEGSFYHDIDNYVIRVESKGLDNSTIHGVIIYDHSGHNGLTKVTVADWGIISMSPDEKEVIFELHDGCNYEETTHRDQKNTPLQIQRLYFKKQMIHFNLESFQLDRTNEDLFKSNHSMQNFSQLNYSIDSLKNMLEIKKVETSKILKNKYSIFNHADSIKQTPSKRTISKLTHKDSAPLQKADIQLTLSKIDSGQSQSNASFLDHFTKEEQKTIISQAIAQARLNKQSMEFFNKDLNNQQSTIRKYNVTLHEKFTLSFACLIMFFIGAPLGAIIRKGGLGISIVISALLFIIFYVMNMIGKEYALAGELPVWMGMWLPSFIFLPLGFFLTIKATNDSPLFDSNSWFKYLSKIQIKILNIFSVRNSKLS